MEQANSKVVFIVNATKRFNSSMRALNSISRQNNGNYEVYVVAGNEKINDSSDIKNLKKVINTKGKEGFVKAYKKIVKNTDDNDFIVAVNYDEIIAPNTVDFLLENGENDIVICNISTAKGKTFKPYYSVKEKLTVKSYLNKGIHLWNNAIKAGVIKKSPVGAGDMSYVEQFLFLLGCYAFSDKIFLSNTVLFYREEIMKSKPIDYKTFSQNRKTLWTIISRMKNSGKTALQEYTVRTFVVPQLGKMYEEKSFINRLKKKYVITKFLGLI